MSELLRVAAVLLLILGTVYIIDWGSKQVRNRLIQGRDSTPALH